MASSKVFVTNANLLRLTTEQRLKALLDYHLLFHMSYEGRLPPIEKPS